MVKAACHIIPSGRRVTAQQGKGQAPLAQIPGGKGVRCQHHIRVHTEAVGRSGKGDTPRKDGGTRDWDATWAALGQSRSSVGPLALDSQVLRALAHKDHVTRAPPEGRLLCSPVFAEKGRPGAT